MVLTGNLWEKMIATVSDCFKRSPNIHLCDRPGTYSLVWLMFDSDHSMFKIKKYSTENKVRVDQSLTSQSMQYIFLISSSVQLDVLKHRIA